GPHAGGARGRAAAARRRGAVHRFGQLTALAQPRASDLRWFMMLRRSLLAGAAALPLATARAQQNYPTKPIRLVVGYSPGGGNDLIARIVGAKLQDKLGQPIVVDNKPGAQSI